MSRIVWIIGAFLIFFSESHKLTFGWAVAMAGIILVSMASYYDGDKS